MASVAATAEDGAAGLVVQADERGSVGHNRNGTDQIKHEASRLNEMAEDDTSDMTAAGLDGDRGDPPADSGRVSGVQDGVDDAPAKPHEAPSNVRGHSRQTTAAETEDKASITPSVDQHDGDKADQQSAEQQPYPDTPREKLVLEKYTLYKTESVSQTYRSVYSSHWCHVNRALTVDHCICSGSTLSARIKAANDTEYSR